MQDGIKDDFQRIAHYTVRQRCQLLVKVVPMALRGLYWRILVRRSYGLLLVGKGVAIRSPQNITFGRNCVIEDYAEIQGLARAGIIFGNQVTVGSHAMIRPSGYYGREIGEGMVIGDNSNIGPYCYIGCSGKIEIGQNVLMGPRVSIIAENHNFGRTDLPIKEQGVTRQAITIEDDSWLGSNSVIVAGTHVGKGSIVAAGAVVTKDVEPYSIVGGIPAHVLRSRLRD